MKNIRASTLYIVQSVLSFCCGMSLSAEAWYSYSTLLAAVVGWSIFAAFLYTTGRIDT